MLEKTLTEFLADTEKLKIGAAQGDEFVKIRTRAGDAILINEEEGYIL